MIIVTYVDDFLIIGPDRKAINQLKVDLNKKFQIDDIGAAKYFVGVRITRDREKKTLSLY